MSFEARERPPESNVIGCFGLNPQTDDRKLREAFGRFGNITKLVIVADRQTGTSRGFGFITFEDVQDARDAVEQMNHSSLDDRKVRTSCSSDEAYLRN